MSERIKEPLQTDTFRSSMTGDSILTSNDEPPVPSEGGQLDAQALSGEHGMLESTNVSTRKQPPAVPPHRASLRNRSPSDPFCDPRNPSSPPALPPRHSPASSPRLEITSPDLASTTASTPFLSASNDSAFSPDPTSPVSPVLSDSEKPLLPARSSQITSPSLEAVKPQFRVFTLPSYLTNPELRSLCRLFPDFISTPARTTSRFRSASVSSTDRTKAQKDAGVNEGAGIGPTKVGHGELRIGSGEREAGWRGTFWERFIAWFKALFSRS